MRDSAIRSRTDDCSASGRPKATRSWHAAHHHRQCPLAGPEGAHHVVDPAGAEARLGGREAAALLAEQRRSTGTRTSSNSTTQWPCWSWWPKTG